MDKNATATIIVAIIGAAAAVISTQYQETSRFEMAQLQESTRLEMARNERTENLRSTLILMALEAEDPRDAAETLKFFVSLGLLGDDLGEKVTGYIATVTIDDTITRFPTIDPRIWREPTSVPVSGTWVIPVPPAPPPLQ